MKNTYARLAAIAMLSFAAAGPCAAGQAGPETGAIGAWQPRLARSRPLIAVVGDNSGTELTDFVIPYGVLARSGVADVLAVATRAGPIQMTPATVRIEPQATTAQFDARFPDGADYVIVPKVSHDADPALLAWIVAQHGKGSAIVSICDGALVLANSGLLNGRRATAHWASESLRAQRYPQVTWVRNARYVVDADIVSSAGISASMPTSLALVEAIAGRAAATALAAQLQLADWSAQHDSDAFHPRLGSNLGAFATTGYLNPWFRHKQTMGAPLAAGVDEIAMALTLDAYARTGRSHAFAVAAAGGAVRSLNGLAFIPERIAGSGAPPELMLAAPGGTAPGRMLQTLLDDIAERYGPATARGVAMSFEYPAAASR